MCSFFIDSDHVLVQPYRVLLWSGQPQSRSPPSRPPEMKRARHVALGFGPSHLAYTCYWSCAHACPRNMACRAAELRWDARRDGAGCRGGGQYALSDGVTLCACSASRPFLWAGWNAFDRLRVLSSQASQRLRAWCWLTKSGPITGITHRMHGPSASFLQSGGTFSKPDARKMRARSERAYMPPLFFPLPRPKDICRASIDPRAQEVEAVGGSCRIPMAPYTGTSRCHQSLASGWLWGRVQLVGGWPAIELWREVGQGLLLNFCLGGSGKKLKTCDEKLKSSRRQSLSPSRVRRKVQQSRT